MKFCTSIHCMDGRIQEPIINYLKKNYSIDFVDTITEPGPIKILSENANDQLVASILNRIKISIEKHGSELIVVSGHYDCAGNPVAEETQKEQIKKSMEFLKRTYPDIEIIGLWIDYNWHVNKI